MENPQTSLFTKLFHSLIGVTLINLVLIGATFSFPETTAVITKTLFVVSAGYVSLSLFFLAIIFFSIGLTPVTPLRDNIQGQLLRDSELHFWVIGAVVIMLLAPSVIFSYLFLLRVAYLINETVYTRYMKQLKELFK